MAKTYGGRIRRIGRKRRVQRVVAKRRTSSLAARPGLNVSAAKSARFFASLPPMMRFKIPWYADTVYVAQTEVVGVPAVPRVWNAYFYLDPLLFDQPVNNVGVGLATQGWYSSEMKGMHYQYSEARFRTHQLHYDFTFSPQRVTNAAVTAAQLANTAQTPMISIACMPVPLKYMRTGANVPHTVAEAGTLFVGGYDYYSALTQTPGAREYTISTLSGSPNCSGSMIIDGFAHNGQSQVQTVNRTAWAQDQDQPVIQYVPANPGTDRTVFLFTLRLPYNPDENCTWRFALRAAYRLDQHMEFYDKTPAFPYTPGTVAAAP